MTDKLKPAQIVTAWRAPLRRRPLRLALLLMLALVILPGALRPAATSQAQGDIAQQVLALVNQERAQAGLHALTLNAQLTAAADRHSRDMAAGGFLDHTGSDGSTFDQRITAAGYSWQAIGENIAQTWAFDAAQVVDLWMNSPGHRANILSTDFYDMGLAATAAANGAVYYAQTFGAGFGAAAAAPTHTPFVQSPILPTATTFIPTAIPASPTPILPTPTPFQAAPTSVAVSNPPPNSNPPAAGSEQASQPPAWLLLGIGFALGAGSVLGVIALWNWQQNRRSSKRRRRSSDFDTYF